jgi:hypothetical protein
MPWTQIAAGDASDKSRQFGGPTRTGLQATIQRRSQAGQHLGASGPFPARGSLVALREPCIVVVYCGKQLWDPGASDANRRQNWNQTAIDWVRQVQRRTEETQRFFCSGLIRLVDGNDIPDLEQAGFDRLDSVTKPRGLNDHYCVGKRGDIGAVLAGADSLDENQRVACGIQQVNEPGGRPGKPPLAAATGHAPDKDTIVRVAIHHANTITEDRATGNRA